MNSQLFTHVIPTGHIDDAKSMDRVISALQQLHGPTYDFAVRRWQGMIAFGSSPGRTRHFFVVEADQTCQVWENLAGQSSAL